MSYADIYRYANQKNDKNRPHFQSQQYQPYRTVDVHSQQQQGSKKMNTQYNSNQFSRTSSNNEQQKHSAFDNWMERISDQSIQSSQHFNSQQQVPYNKYLDTLRNQGGEGKMNQNMMRFIIKKKQGQTDQKDQRKKSTNSDLQKLIMRRTENSEYKQHFIPQKQQVKYSPRQFTISSSSKQSRYNSRHTISDENKALRQFIGQSRTQETQYTEGDSCNNLNNNINGSNKKLSKEELKKKQQNIIKDYYEQQEKKYLEEQRDKEIQRQIRKNNNMKQFNTLQNSVDDEYQKIFSSLQNSAINDQDLQEQQQMDDEVVSQNGEQVENDQNNDQDVENDQNNNNINIEEQQQEINNDNAINLVENYDLQQQIQEQDLENLERRNQVQNFVEQNQEYYDHLRGKCPCIQSDSCGLQKCSFFQVKLKPDMKKLSKSIYGLDFDRTTTQDSSSNQERMHQNSDRNLNAKQMLKMLSNGDSKKEHINLQSVQQKDFQSPNGAKKADLQRPQELQKGNFPLGRTQYQTQFFDYKKVPYSKINGMKLTTSVKGLPFFSSTTYKDFHGPQSSNLGQDLEDKAEPLGNNWKTSLVKSAIPFLAETTQKNFYQPYKGKKTKIEKQVAMDELVVKDHGIYNGQFDSNYKKAYKRQIQTSFGQARNPGLTYTSSQSCKQENRKKYQGSQYVPVRNLGNSNGSGGLRTKSRQGIQRISSQKQF